MDSEFESRLVEQVTGIGLAGKAEKHLLDAKAAKRVRPRFLFACGALLNVPSAELLDLACGVELIHTATLVHDDILDDALERRGRPSVNAAFGNKIAVLAGDALLARALILFTHGPQPEATIRAGSEAFLTLVEACIIELENLHKTDLDTKTLLQIVDGKTGALFALCGELAGIVAKNESAKKQFSCAGTLLGRAFQIKDDIEDMEEDKANGTPTLPLTIGKKAALTKAGQAITEALSLFDPYKKHTAYKPLIDTIHTLARL